MSNNGRMNWCFKYCVMQWAACPFRGSSDPGTTGFTSGQTDIVTNHKLASPQDRRTLIKSYFASELIDTNQRLTWKNPNSIEIDNQSNQVATLCADRLTIISKFASRPDRQTRNFVLKHSNQFCYCHLRQFFYWLS